MNIFDYYTLELYINDRRIEEIGEGEFSFSLIDSIHSLYNTAIITLHDITGLFQEYLATSEGLEIQLNYGIKHRFPIRSSLMNKYDIYNQKDSSAGFLSGDVDCHLVNNWYNQQNIKCKAYQDSISNIIRNLIGSNFMSTDIEVTLNTNIWYQTLMTDAKFIQEILLPNSFSLTASQTPFYCFINSDNTFNFKSLQTMLNAGIVGTVDYKTQTVGTSSSNITSEVRRWHQNSDEHRSLKKRAIYKIDRTTGALIEKSDTLTDYPNKMNKTTTILDNIKTSNDPLFKTGYLNLQFSETEPGKIQNQMGLKSSTMKPSMFLDRFMVTTSFNPNFKSGKNIQLNIYTMDGTEKKSKNFSGVYTIEQCEHIWNRESRRGFTKLIVGKKYVMLPSSYYFSSLLI